MNNAGFFATGVSLMTLGILGFILTENQFAAGGSLTPYDDGYYISQLAKAGAAGTLIIGFGITVISAAGLNREELPDNS